MLHKPQLAFPIFLLTALGMSALAPAGAFADVEPGDTPAYTATTLDGTSVTAKELRGKVVLVDFWATWCGPCKDSFPFYATLVDTYDGQLVVLAASVDAKRSLVRAFLKESDVLEENPSALTVVWHKDQLMARTFGPSMFPTSYLIDKEGVVRHIHTGFDEEVREKTSAQIKALVDP